MTPRLENLFSSEDLKRIEEAVRNAEKQTSGEIVPYAVQSSDDYEETLWRAGMLFAMLTLFGFALVHNYSESWLPFHLVEAALGTIGAALAGVLLAYYVAPVKRIFAGNTLMTRRVTQRAEEAFLAEEVFETKDRTGILLFISLLEHKVVVLGDSGINAKVQPEEWDSVVDILVKGMKDRKPADGLLNAITMCGELLKREGVARRADDSDELSNKMRLSKQ